MNDQKTLRRRVAKNGTLIVGGGFAGAHVARLLGRAGATIVSPESSMLYAPLLPEVAAGAIEPRHVYVPLHAMCPHAELLRGYATDLDERWRTLIVQTGVGQVEVEYERLIIALGRTARMLPIPGLAERAIAFKNLGDAIHLRNHILRRLDLAEVDPDNAERYLTFVFVGAGYAGVEALAVTCRSSSTTPCGSGGLSQARRSDGCLSTPVRESSARFRNGSPTMRRLSSSAVAWRSSARRPSTQWSPTPWCSRTAAGSSPTPWSGQPASCRTPSFAN